MKISILQSSTQSSLPKSNCNQSIPPLDGVVHAPSHKITFASAIRDYFITAVVHIITQFMNKNVSLASSPNAFCCINLLRRKLVQRLQRGILTVAYSDR